MRAYRVLVGLNYPTKAGEKRAEPGDVIDDLPAKSVHWLLEQGHIEGIPGGIHLVGETGPEPVVPPAAGVVKQMDGED